MSQALQATERQQDHMGLLIFTDFKEFVKWSLLPIRYVGQPKCQECHERTMLDSTFQNHAFIAYESDEGFFMVTSDYFNDPVTVRGAMEILGLQKGLFIRHNEGLYEIYELDRAVNIATAHCRCFDFPLMTLKEAYNA